MKPSEIIKSLKMLALYEGSEIGASEILNEAAALLESLTPKPVGDFEKGDEVRGQAVISAADLKPNFSVIEVLLAEIPNVQRVNEQCQKT